MPDLLINGQSRPVDDPDQMPLLWPLRDVLGMTGAKFDCGIARCGACTVLIGGQPVRSCLLPVRSIGNTPNGKKVQQAWLAKEVVQCGYCQSGQIMAATALQNQTPKPADAAIDMAMSPQHLSMRHLRAYPRGHPHSSGVGGASWHTTCRRAESVVTGRKSGAGMARLYGASQPTVSRIVAEHLADRP